MEGHCSTGQSSQWAVVPMEEEEEEEVTTVDKNMLKEMVKSSLFRVVREVTVYYM